MALLVSVVTTSLAPADDVGIPVVSSFEFLIPYERAKSITGRLRTYFIECQDAKIGEHLALLNIFVLSTQEVSLLVVLLENKWRQASHGLTWINFNTIGVGLADTFVAEGRVSREDDALGVIVAFTVQSFVIRAAFALVCVHVVHFSSGSYTRGAIELGHFSRVTRPHIGAFLTFVGATAVNEVPTNVSITARANSLGRQLNAGVTARNAFFPVL